MQATHPVTSSNPSNAAPPSAVPNTHPFLPFLRGGISGVLSWLFIHPADVIKVRMQLSTTSSPTSSHAQYRGVIDAVQQITRSEGVGAMYSGLSAALTRQITYTTLRLGLYSTIRDAVADDGGNISVWTKFGVGMMSGAVASGVSTPVEVAMVRMYADGAAEKAVRRGYRHVGDALWRIAREEGVFGLWRGASPTVARSMVVNCVQLGTYDQAKEVYMKRWGMRDGVGVHLMASVTSGFCYSVATLPIDSAKTRLQDQRELKGGGFKYKGLAQTIMLVGREEGIAGLWRGFLPYFSRCAGHTIAMFLVLEQVKKVI